jgi:hypothetical protein
VTRGPMVFQNSILTSICIDGNGVGDHLPCSLLTQGWVEGMNSLPFNKCVGGYCSGGGAAIPEAGA